MLAHRGARAGCSRTSFRGEVYPPPEQESELTNSQPNPAIDQPNTPTVFPSGRPIWKNAYEAFLWSRHKLPLNLRAILQVLVRLSDHLGRVWWSQASIAEQAGCTVRTLRRLLPALETNGYARVQRMTFRQLAVAQAALGLPLPGRNDDGQGPDLITLLFEGKPAVDLRPTSPRRLSGPGQVVQASPRTSLSSRTIHEPSHTEDSSSPDPRDLSVDLYKNVGDPKSETPPFVKEFVPSKPIDTVSHEISLPVEISTEALAWKALETAYETHFKRVYHARPTNKPLPADSRALMAGHLADMAKLLRARFVERNTNLSTLPKSSVELLADEAMRAWFDSSGTNDYLRRVSHRMSALPADLPYRVRKAIDVLLEQFAPKPQPRQALPPIDLLLQTAKMTTPASTRLEASFASPSTRTVGSPKPTIVKTTLSPDVLLVLAGLSQHASLHDLSQTPTLANDLLIVARGAGGSPGQIIEALELAAKVCQRKRMASSSERMTLVHKVVAEFFESPRQTCSSA